MNRRTFVAICGLSALTGRNNHVLLGHRRSAVVDLGVPLDNVIDRGQVRIYAGKPGAGGQLLATLDFNEGQK